MFIIIMDTYIYIYIYVMDALPYADTRVPPHARETTSESDRTVPRTSFASWGGAPRRSNGKRLAACQTGLDKRGSNKMPVNPS